MIIQYVLWAFGEVSRSPFNWDRMNVISLGMSSICPTGPLRHRIMSPMLAYVSPVPCILGINIMRMAVVWLRSSSGLWCRLKDPFDIHSSRTAMATVCIRRFIWILAKRMSPRQRPTRLNRVSNGYRRWTFYGRKGLFKHPVRHLQ